MEATIMKILSALMSFILALSSFFGVPTGNRIRNVIYMIGDGMGENHLAMTEQMYNVSLNMNTMPQQGYSMTYSAGSLITDSAAGATALATGMKTNNGVIGMFPDKNGDLIPAKSITRICMENRMKTGVITSDELSAATPGGFTAHTSSRSNHEDITSQQIETGFDIMWGREDGTLTEEQVIEKGYVYIDTTDEMNAPTGNEKSYGMFTSSVYHTYNKNSYTPTLSQMTEKAIELLDSTSDKSFFLMVEGAHIDKKSHNEDEEGAAEALCEFDNAVEKALEFAKADGSTLVIVTADHETGGVTLQEDGTYTMTTGSHTSEKVPVRAYSKTYYPFIENGERINNIDIPEKILEALGLSDVTFPCPIVD